MVDQMRRVLVVDDLPDWRTTLGGLLRDGGFDVVAADSVDQAFQLLQDQHFDAAVLDIRLEDSNDRNEEGLELARKIKARWPGIKIVIVTGYSTEANRERTMKPDKHGIRLVDDYLFKTQSDRLASVVQRLLTP